MARKYNANLKTIIPSPQENPLIEPQTIKTRKRAVQAGRGDDLVNVNTGELSAISVIKTIEEKDDADFVKVFADGVVASYGLSKTAQRVFHVILEQYQKTPMSKGYADAVRLYWFGEGLDGVYIGMSKYTFNRGLRELLDKRFIYPKDTASYWTNPALFFKGNRVLFLKEYRRKRKPKEVENITSDIEENIEGGLSKLDDPYTADLPLDE